MSHSNVVHFTCVPLSLSSSNPPPPPPFSPPLPYTVSPPLLPSLTPFSFLYFLPPPLPLISSLSRDVEAYWNSMNSICEESFDDQGKLNCGLKALGIKWFNNDSSYQNTTVTGITKSGLKVSILPYDDICRQLTCLPEMRSRYYIWHKGGHRQRRDKVKYAKEGQTWFLRYHWNSILNNYTGVKWLQSIAYYMATHS